MRKILLVVFFFFLFTLGFLSTPPTTSAGLFDLSWRPIGGKCYPMFFSSIGYPTEEACRKVFDECPLNGDKDILIKPCIVDESAPTVSLTINNIPAPKTQPKKNHNYYCLKTAVKDCGEDDWNSIKDGDVSIPFKTLCGDGSSSLKTDCKTDGSDWFHVEKTYRVIVAQGTSEKNTASSNGNTIVKTASFYIRHFYPQVLTPINSNAGQGKTMESFNITTIKANSGLDIPLTLNGRDNKEGKGDSDVYNDYWVMVFSQDSDYRIPFANNDNQSCLYINPDSQSGSKTIHLPASYQDSYGNTIEIAPGSYVLRIKDGKGGNTPLTGDATCYENTFTYYDIPFSIGGTDNEGTSKEVRHPGQMGTPIVDPFGKEGGVKGLQPPAPPICTQKDANGYCTAIPTALGFSIHTDPRTFVRDIFSLVLSIGGLAALMFFIQAGYTLMTSAGNKEKVGQAREQITAAITGLIFIILSISILEFIGINILHIPGFGR